MEKLQINFNNILEIMTTAKWKNLEGGKKALVNGLHVQPKH